MTSIQPDDDSSSSLEWINKNGEIVEFDRSISANTIAANKYTNKATPAIFFYIGSGSVRTLVAVRKLGSIPLVKTMGIVLRSDNKAHTVTIMNMSAAEETLHLDAKTIVDTDHGVTCNFKYEFSKDQQIRILATTQPDGGESAILITRAE